LPNGLTVYVWEDASQPNVFGLVGVNVGAANDPENLTGLAHYLEHVLFKGTQKIGTTNWEKEKPFYEQIIAKYDELADTQDPIKKTELSKEINRLNTEAAQYMALNEFSSLTEKIGGSNLNAGTSWDYTVYYSSFPPTEIYRWLELNSERFINPVFRTFQSELETVYEEYNMGMDEQGRQIQNFLLENAFPGHPYARQIIGKPEHLKNPRLSALIDFYNQWYVPGNMTLVLVGNVKASQVQGIIQDKFGRLEAKPVPERKTYPEWNVKGRKSVSAKLSPYPQVALAFQGVTTGSEDEIALEICMSMLSNRSRTGLLDKLALEGDLMSASASLLKFKDQGRILISAIPYYDVNQRRFSSLRSTERTLWNEIKKLQEGKVEEWLLQSIKGTMIRNFDLSFESPYTKGNMIAETFLTNQDISQLLTYKDRVDAITLEQIKAAAGKYLTDDFLVLEIQEGKSKTPPKIEKPPYDPVIPQRNARSEYAGTFEKLPVMKWESSFLQFSDVQSKKVNALSELFYTKNPENEIFTLTLKYGVGTALMPKLEYAVQLMNNAGIMGQFEPQQLKQAFSELGASCHFSVDDSYLYITMEGYEANLEASCQLLTRQILMPKLEEKQLNNIVGGVMQNRRMEKEYVESLKDALPQYLLYQDKSEYIDRLPMTEISNLTVSNLTGEFSRATDYEAEIHYVGALSFETVYETLSKNLPLKENERKTTSPEIKDRATYSENTVYFLADNDAQQSAIYFLIEGKPFDANDDVLIDGFNQYFSGSFDGLVMQEIREYRSMAYSAYGRIRTPVLPGKNIHLIGSIGTQSDKTIDAMEQFLSLVDNMPEYPDRMENIKGYLQKTTLTSRPTFRTLSQYIERCKLLGFTQDPAISRLPAIERLTFDDLRRFYLTEIKGKPIAIAIIGDPKQIDAKKLEKFGNLIRINSSKLFSAK
jgi:predicted Zn-dependent peptidase